MFPSRKLYWTDGDNISMANMDGTNQTTLFSGQKGPVGEQLFPLTARKKRKKKRKAVNNLVVILQGGSRD